MRCSSNSSRLCSSNSSRHCNSSSKRSRSSMLSTLATTLLRPHTCSSVAAQQQHQAATPGAPPPPAGQPAAVARPEGGLSVAGCQNPTVSGIVRGSYAPYGENHGRYVYRKTSPPSSIEVLMYYWDERDGPNFCGWWFGPKVGGDQVWAYSSEHSMAPPSTGWRVPYDGPVDATLVVAHGNQQHQQQHQQQHVQPQSAQHQEQQQQQQQHWQQQQQQQQGSALPPPPPVPGQQPGPGNHGKMVMPPGQQQQQSQQQHPQQESRYESYGGYENKYDKYDGYNKQQWKDQGWQDQDGDRQRRRDDDWWRQDSDQQRREGEDSRYREDDQSRQRAEQEAQMRVKNMIQKVKWATADDFEHLKAEAESVLSQELPRCGDQADQLRGDMTRQIEQSAQYLEDEKETRRQEEEKRQQDEKQRVEQEELARKLLGELGELVDKAEANVTRLREVVAAASVPENSEESTAVVAAMASANANTVAEAAGDAKGATSACIDFAASKRSSLEGPQRAPSAKEFRGELHKMLQRVQECGKFIVSAVERTNAMRDQAEAKVRAEKRFARREALFDKYDADKDGELNGREILEYARGEFGFVVPDEAVKRMLEQLAHQGRGVPRAAFHSVTLAVGVARDEEASCRRKAQMEERRNAVQAAIDRANGLLADADGAVIAAESKVPGSSDSASSQGEAEVRAGEDACTRARELIVAAREAVAAARAEVPASGGSSVAGETLRRHAEDEVRALENRAETFERRLAEASTSLRTARERLAAEALAELEKLVASVSKSLMAVVAEKKITAEELFTQVDKDQDGLANEAEFSAFLAERTACGLDAETVGRLVNHLSEPESRAVNRATFLGLVRAHFVVVKETVMTSDMSIKDSKTIRRLDVHEAVEVLDGPLKDEELGITRLKACAVKDGAIGWATLHGNEGSTFLESCGCVFEVLSEQPLTADLAGQTPAGTLSSGDRVVVLEWDRKEAGSDVSRMRVKVRGKVVGASGGGWLRKVGEREAQFLRRVRS
eukprot:TRINITY_DN480_c0_g2_i2.p1 TRINITY_DN480_c0_g2~~TRINITY_DN480_c0_g2_i2.p1  ORF type:complete len:1009 (-),score=267.50 TRINITY_DN480_c0_g2_i2:216-3242(-)